MKKIHISQGKAALVDDSDFHFLNQWKWSLYKAKGNKTFYAIRHVVTKNGKRGTITMHRALMAARGKARTDHKDGNGLNNQKSNLRPATHSQNLANSRKRKDNASGFKGVWWDKTRRMWRAAMSCDCEWIHLGYFADRLSAARAYDKSAEEKFGQFAKTNASLGLL